MVFLKTIILNAYEYINHLAVVEREEEGVGDVEGVAGVAMLRHKGVHRRGAGGLPAAMQLHPKIIKGI